MEPGSITVALPLQTSHVLQTEAPSQSSAKDIHERGAPSRGHVDQALEAVKQQQCNQKHAHQSSLYANAAWK